MGRFQPFHNGHLDAIRQIFQYEKHLIIGIGSAENHHEADNPWSASERYRMIDESLKNAGYTCGQYCIIPVRNIDNYPLWPGHVERLVPPFETVYTGSPIVETLFKENTNHPVTKLDFNLDVTATDIRNRIKTNETWDDIVPGPAARLIKEWDTNRVT